MAHAPPDAIPHAGEATPALRRGWTTGACAAAAAKAAACRLFTGTQPASVDIPLPSGARPTFAIAHEAAGEGWAEAGVVKDAGDDPDVTHGALVITRIAIGLPGQGLIYRAGPGVGTVTRPGLPLAPGEAAINPGPRGMIEAALGEVASHRDLIVRVGVPDGERLAERTLNGRLGIVGGLSILGTTGVVIPFSCAAWIDTIHRGIDVARASGLTHIAGATGTTSEASVRRLYALPEPALIEMGDFVGGMLKYLRRHPVPRLTIAGGFAKMSKLGQGRLDLHSKRGQVDLAWLGECAQKAGGGDALRTRLEGANTAAEARTLAKAEGVELARPIADAARATVAAVLEGTGIELDTVVVDRNGEVLAVADRVTV